MIVGAAVLDLCLVVLDVGTIRALVHYRRS